MPRTNGYGWRGRDEWAASTGLEDPGHGGVHGQNRRRQGLPAAKSLFEQVGNMMILTGKTMTVVRTAALSLRGRVRQPVPVRAAADVFRC